MATEVDADTVHDSSDQAVDFVPVDTLPAEVHARHHIPGASNTVFDDIGTEAPRRMPARHRPVVVYCTSTACRRREEAAARLERLGCRDVRDFVAGRRQWEDGGYPVESGSDWAE